MFLFPFQLLADKRASNKEASPYLKKDGKKHVFFYLWISMSCNCHIKKTALLATCYCILDFIIAEFADISTRKNRNSNRIKKGQSGARSSRLCRVWGRIRPLWIGKEKW
jgi:hypothetical protein